MKEPFLGCQNQSGNVMVVVLVWGICDTPLSSWEQTSLRAAQADNMLGQRDLGICHTVLQVITRTDKLLSRGGFVF